MSQPPYPPPPPRSVPPPPPGPPPGPPYGRPQRNRVLPVVLAVVAAVLVIAAAITIPLLVASNDDDGAGGGTEEATAADGSTTAVALNLDDVKEYDGLTRNHRLGSVDYPQSPPVGGDHNPQWLECGVYDFQVPAENLVHDLEHGTIVISYRPDDVDSDGIDQLAGQLPQNGIMTPWPDQEAPVEITAWGRQLDLVGPDDPRIALFVQKYGAGDTAPEPYVSCAGGITPTPGSTA